MSAEMSLFDPEKAALCVAFIQKISTVRRLLRSRAGQKPLRNKRMQYFHGDILPHGQVDGQENLHYTCFIGNSSIFL